MPSILKLILLFFFILFTAFLPAQNNPAIGIAYREVSIDSVYVILDNYVKKGAVKFYMVYQPVKGDAMVMHSNKSAKEILKKASPKPGDRIIIGNLEGNRPGRKSLLFIIK